ncbi:MAG: carboxypeptidase-like regulatory domain-containing protein [Rhodothermales bacterium]
MSFTFASARFLFLLCLPGLAFAQTEEPAVVRGTATDAETGTPLAGAHVFIGSTMMGTATDAEGRFELLHPPSGPNTLWISMIGYEPESKDFLIGDTTSFEINLSLKPMVVALDGVTVTAKKDRRWKKRMKTFEKLFIGESNLSSSVKILNKEVLDFESNWLGRFAAHASESLIMENQALGYRVQYVLKEFSREGITIRYDGDPFFEELEPGSPEEQAIWEENRRIAYLGSFKHFLLALLDGTTYEEGFRLKHIHSIEDIQNPGRHFNIAPEKLLSPGEEAGDQLLAFRGVIQITYLHETEGSDYLKWQGASPHRRSQNQRSWIRLTTGPTLIDPIGEIVDPYGVTVYGYYAFERVANDLPKEYRILPVDG